MDRRTLLVIGLATAFVAIVTGLIVRALLQPGGPVGGSTSQVLSYLIDSQAMPNGWRESERGPHTIPQGEAPLGGGISSIASAEVLFYFPVGDGTGTAREEIYLFRTSEDAASEFALGRSKWFAAGPDGQEWADAPMVDFESQLAHQIRLGCYAGAGGDEDCQMLGQYSAYMVRFITDMVAFDRTLQPTQVMTYGDLAIVLRQIDRKMDFVGP